MGKKDRKYLGFDNIGTSWSDSKEIRDVPKFFTITRVRANIVGSANSVAVSIRERSTIDDILQIPLEYDLTTNPLDSFEDIFVVAHDTNSTRKIYVAVRCDSGIDNHVDFIIEWTAE